MDYKDGLSIGGNIFSYVLSAVQQNEILQVISMVLSVLTSLVILAYNIWKWYRKAKEDGKITKEEIDELGDILQDGKDDIERNNKK